MIERKDGVVERSVPGEGKGSTSAFRRLGLLAYRRRWVIVALWVAAAFVAAPLIGDLSGRLAQGGFEVRGSQSAIVRQALEQDFGRSQVTDVLVVHSDALSADQPEFRSAVAEVRAALAAAPGVGAVSDPYETPERSVSDDGRSVIATVSLTEDQNLAQQHAVELNDAVERAARGRPVQALLTGGPPFFAELSERSARDLAAAEQVALPISFLILLLAFGSLLAAGMPVVLAMLGLGISFGLISLLAALTQVSVFTLNVASMIGIGVGIDYALFIVNRFRQARRTGLAVAEAIGDAMESSGKAAFVSGLTVVVALSGTTLVNIAAFQSMGWGAMIAVATMMAAAMTLLPALLGVFGGRLDVLSFRRRGRGDSRFWHRWALAVMGRPWPYVLGSFAVLLVLAMPAADLRLGSPGPAILPADASPRVAAELAARAFGEGAGAPVQVVLRGADFTREGFSAVRDSVLELERDPAVVRVDSVAALCPPARCETPEETRSALQSAPEVAGSFLTQDGRQTLLTVVTKHGAQSDEAKAFVERARLLLPAVLPAGVTALVGGDAAANVDISAEVGGKLILVVALVLGLSYLLLLLFFRSVLLPLKAVLMNAASVMAVYGVLVFVFQEGNFEGLLGFSSVGYIDAFLPLFLFCVLFGLSMDYEVFLLSRIREEYLAHGDNTEAVGWGLEHTASVITSAAAIMFTVFGAFAATSLLPIKSMGFGLAAAVLIDATIVRIVLVPATMRLLGHWNWWLPRWLERLLPAVSIEGVRAQPIAPRVHGPERDSVHGWAVEREDR